MKKVWIIVLTAFTLIALAACNDNSEEQNYSATQASVHDVMESLAGAWDLTSAGILIDVYIDGIWSTSWGDIEFRGMTELTQDNDDYIVEFIILEQRGPGAMYDSYGNIREEAFNVETNQYYWIPYPDEYSSWLFGKYFANYDRLIIERIWGNEFDLGQEMERIW